MSNIKNGGLDQYGKVWSLNGIGYLFAFIYCEWWDDMRKMLILAAWIVHVSFQGRSMTESCDVFRCLCSAECRWCWRQVTCQTLFPMRKQSSYTWRICALGCWETAMNSMQRASYSSHGGVTKHVGINTWVLNHGYEKWKMKMKNCLLDIAALCRIIHETLKHWNIKTIKYSTKSQCTCEILRQYISVSAPCGLRGCKNRAHSVSWPEVVKGVPNQGVDCFSVSGVCSVVFDCSWLSIPVQLIAWKDSSPKWPIVCGVRR